MMAFKNNNIIFLSKYIFLSISVFLIYSITISEISFAQKTIFNADTVIFSKIKTDYGDDIKDPKIGCYRKRGYRNTELILCCDTINISQFVKVTNNKKVYWSENIKQWEDYEQRPLVPTFRGIYEETILKKYKNKNICLSIWPIFRPFIRNDSIIYKIDSKTKSDYSVDKQLKSIRIKKSLEFQGVLIKP